MHKGNILLGCAGREGQLQYKRWGALLGACYFTSS
jgi:hypothetical protein